MFKTWFPLAAWAGLIFFLSHQPDLESGLPHFWDHILRKLAHVTEYAVLTFLAFRAFYGTGQAFGRAFGGAVVFAFLYSASDEYHQTFVPLRYGEVKDILIDSVGIFLTGVWLIKRNSSDRRREKDNRVLEIPTDK